MNIIKRIKSERIGQGLTLNELGRKVGMTKQGVYEFERGIKDPRISTLQKFCKALKLNLIIKINEK